jgi:phosphodiesterase/alkaline phosphatase D-like protein
MAQLIIGHTTDTTARIWVRATKCDTCDVSVEGSTASTTRRIRLTAETDYTGIADFVDLHPDTRYAVSATFLPRGGPPVLGRFRTMAGPTGEPVRFSFVLSSCNLSVVSINNLLSYLLAAGGTVAAEYSLDLPLERWHALRFLWLRRLVRKPLRWGLYGVAWAIRRVTQLKQPPPPRLRSPFLKLAAVFEPWAVEVSADQKSLPAVGDVVSAAGAEGVMACSASRLTEGDASRGVPPTWLIVLAQVTGTFTGQQRAFKRSPRSAPDKNTPIGDITKVWFCTPWHREPPAFFLHAGDQIYYDFPTATRLPELSAYRLAYREAWLDDDGNRYLLSHYPHYMTLDDHEIVDQFAEGFVPPAKGVRPDDYLRPATAAYREYVHGRHPGRAGNGATGAAGADPLWYQFDKGCARFFVLDTRTRRVNHDPPADSQMLDDAQMERLLAWMAEYRHDLKFIVTSVPFVAQISASPRQDDPDWFSATHTAGPGHPPGSGRAPRSRQGNDGNDTWSADRFRSQRDRVIEYIAAQGIEHVVFLTGDMHCCYHATMQIGGGSRYESTTVHELAGGPVNQLQLASATDFLMRHTGRTRHHDVPYEIVLDRFHSDVNAVMHLSVDYVGDQLAGTTLVPQVDWTVIRTLTDNGAAAWEMQESPSSKPTVIKTLEDPVRVGEPTMSGRVSFIQKRTPASLPSWP